MTSVEFPFAMIRFDGGTQVRAGDDAALIADYAERMGEGAVFPPIVIFVDGETAYLADGYHRCRAAQRLGRTTIMADVYAGTQHDALWYALGANRTNGRRLTTLDKTHAVQLALKTWPEKGSVEIARQVGCSTSLVSKVADRIAKNTGGAPAIRGRALVNQTRRAAVRALVLAGEQSIAIQKATGVHSGIIADVRRELGLSTIDYSRRAVKARRERAREMAADGNTSRQIAADLGISEEGCRLLLRKAGITVPGDVVTRGLHHHDSNRIMATIVADADDLAAGANLIDFAQLDRTQLADWITSLRNARTTLTQFIKRLMQEPSHGEAA